MHPVDQYKQTLQSLSPAALELAEDARGYSQAMAQAIRSGDRAGYDRAVRGTVDLSRRQVAEYYKMTGRRPW